MKIDLHVHTCERSACATASENEQIEAAILKGLDAIVITDHHALVSRAHLDELNRTYAPFKIFGGIEITSSFEDWLVLGLRDHALERTDWEYPALHAFVRQRGGWIALAHPYRYRPEVSANLARYTPDAIEGRSNNVRIENVARIRRLAESHGLPLLCNSDAHTADKIGLYYNILDVPDLSDEGLIQALRGNHLKHSVK